MWLRLWLTWRERSASKNRKALKTQQQVTWSWLQVQIAMPELISEKLQHRLPTARRLVNVPKPKKTSIFSNPNNSSICPSQKFWSHISPKSSTDGSRSMTKTNSLDASISLSEKCTLVLKTKLQTSLHHTTPLSKKLCLPRPQDSTKCSLNWKRNKEFKPCPKQESLMARQEMGE